MEKISIRPNATDIVIDAASANELNEVFSYNYGTSAGGSEDDIRRLGSLFIVGQIQPRNDDTAYVLNLIASLAKREYYLPANEYPKEAFSKTLKKINEALDDFFKDKDLKINIGVFAIAGETVLVSKMGKFKLLLARENQVVDVLNNISMFNKEQAKETKFSSVISGKVSPGDNLFAYYPSRSALAREKSLRTELLSVSGSDIAAKFADIRSQKDTFSLSAVHLAITKYKEPAVLKRPQPTELKAKIAAATPVATPVTRTSKRSSAPVATAPAVSEPSASEAPMPVQVAIHETEESTGDPVAVRAEAPIEEPPFIIPSEFGMARKSTIFSSAGSLIGEIFRNLTTISRATAKKQSLVFFIGLLLLVGIAYGIKAVVFTQTGDQGLDTALNDADMSIKLAKTKINQNEVASARQILSSSLLHIFSSAQTEPRTAAAKEELLAVLDEIDKAVDASPALIFSFDPTVSGAGQQLTIAGDTVVVSTDTNNMLVKKGDDPERTIHIEGVSSSHLFGLTDKVITLDTITKKIAVTRLADGATTVAENVNIPDNALDFYFYESNLYGMTADNILRIIDAGNGKSQFSAWFSDTTNLPPSPALLTVDGDIFVWDKAGTITKYFKGEKVSEKNIPIIPDEGFEMVTTAEATVFYLINTQLGRIYVVHKETGALERVLKINNTVPIADVALGADQSLYFLTADHKVWKLAP